METLIKLTRKFDMRIFLSLALPWILLWFLPWAAWLHELPWLRLGLAGLIFIAPGLAASMCLMGNRLTLLSHFTSGLVLSMFLVSSLGVMGRVVHLPFAFIKPVFFVVGLLIFAVLARASRLLEQFFKPASYSILSVVLLLLLMALGAIVSLSSRFEIQSDSFSYLAYLTNWQHAARLNLGEVIFGSGNLDRIRFWLAMFPMNQAFLAEISDLPGVFLLGYYLKPVLVSISLLALYNFYEDLLQSNRQATMALLLQFTFLFLLLEIRQPGNLFFLRIIEDKSFAAFAIAPVLFLAVNCFLVASTFRHGIFVLLSGWSLALAHPVILAFSIFIASFYVILTTLVQRNYKTLVILLALLVCIILPPASLRFVSLHGVKTQAAFDLESALDPTTNFIGDRIWFIEGTPFYGFNLDKIKVQIFSDSLPSWINFFLVWSFLWLIGLGFLWSLPKLSRPNNALAAFIAAAALLVLLCAIPYTGWLAGYFVSARMLWRSPLLFPVGLVVTGLMTDVLRVISSKVTRPSRLVTSLQDTTFFSVIALCIVLIIYSYNFGYQTRLDSVSKLSDYKIQLEEYAALGGYLETHVEQPSIFIASYEMLNYLPGLSSKAKVVFFRSSKQTPHNVRLSEIEKVFSSDVNVSITRRMDVLDKYRIQYILIEDAALQEYYSDFSQFFNWQKFGKHWLIEYKAPAP